eukprot:TRINITY_DN8629_c0_g1_i1.p1 TRINITY_DN8629_c0_g1~~TRINITY_DN8629_c0_g1_i1.p1  ORF type:complete len:252 (-),score=60.41 TRINITY_DN8629_c0_g1_i1:89-844(-)
MEDFFDKSKEDIRYILSDGESSDSARDYSKQTTHKSQKQESKPLPPKVPPFLHYKSAINLSTQPTKAKEPLVSTVPPTTVTPTLSTLRLQENTTPIPKAHITIPTLHLEEIRPLPSYPRYKHPKPKPGVKTAASTPIPQPKSEINTVKIINGNYFDNGKFRVINGAPGKKNEIYQQTTYQNVQFSPPSSAGSSPHRPSTTGSIGRVNGKMSPISESTTERDSSDESPMLSNSNIFIFDEYEKNPIKKQGEG